MKLTASQFMYTLGVGEHFPVITENRFHRLNARVHRKRTRVPKQDWRRKLFDRQCGICPYCGQPMTMDHKDRKAPNYLTEEHVTPVSRTPFPGTPRVVVGACQRCNAMKGSTPLLLFVYHLNRQATA